MSAWEKAYCPASQGAPVIGHWVRVIKDKAAIMSLMVLRSTDLSGSRIPRPH